MHELQQYLSVAGEHRSSTLQGGVLRHMGAAAGLVDCKAHDPYIRRMNEPFLKSVAPRTGI